MNQEFMASQKRFSRKSGVWYRVVLVVSDAEQLRPVPSPSKDRLKFVPKYSQVRPKIFPSSSRLNKNNSKKTVKASWNALNLTKHASQIEKVKFKASQS
jgi:hypothetical protein